MNPLAVDAIGIITPGAGDAAASVALIHTTARRFDDLPRVGGRAHSGAKTPIPDDVVGLDRLVRLGAHALWEAIDADLATAKVGLVVCAPSEVDEPGIVGQAESLLTRLAAEAELSLAPRASRVFPSGRAAVFDALPFALAAVVQPDVAAICILGVDSLVTKPRLKLLLERGGNLGPGHPSPGEAAAAVVLKRQPGPESLALLVGLGMSREPLASQEGRPKLGSGFLAALDQAAASARLPQPVFSRLVADTIGTAMEAEELAWAKTGQAFMASPNMECVFPYVSTGNAGAAMGPLALATGAFLVDKAVGTGPALCCLSSGQSRAAAILAPVPGHVVR